MNYHRFLLILLAALPGAAFAADWETMSHTPAQIEVVEMHPEPLVEKADKNGWAKVPAPFGKYGAEFQRPCRGGGADFRWSGG